jgi:hypothetical protein
VKAIAEEDKNTSSAESAEAMAAETNTQRRTQEIEDVFWAGSNPFSLRPTYPELFKLGIFGINAGVAAG